MTFSALEMYALKTRNIPTFSHVTRHHTRKNKIRKAVATTAMTSAFGWLTWHFIFED